MRERWLSRRAVALHAGVLVAVPACALAAWWQINRAQDGNQLSYFYSVMWPVFGLLALWFWWILVHTDYDQAGLKGMRRTQDQRPTSESVMDGTTSLHPPEAIAEDPARPVSDEDPELTAYNARLAQLASRGPKTWRRRESVVVRRTQ